MTKVLKYVGFALLFLFQQAACSAQESPEKQEVASISAIKEMWNAVGIGGFEEELVGKLKDGLKAIAPDNTDEFLDGVISELDVPSLDDSIAEVYQKYLTQEDVEGVLRNDKDAFAKLKRVEPQIIEEAMVVIDKWKMNFLKQVIMAIQLKRDPELASALEPEPAEEISYAAKETPHCSQEELVGRWEVIAMAVEMDGEPLPAEEDEESMIFVFYSDGTYEMKGLARVGYKFEGNLLVLNGFVESVKMAKRVVSYEDGVLKLEFKPDASMKMTIEMVKSGD